MKAPCSECGAPLPPRRSKTCSAACMKERARRMEKRERLCSNSRCLCVATKDEPICSRCLPVFDQEPKRMPRRMPYAEALRATYGGTSNAAQMAEDRARPAPVTVKPLKGEREAEREKAKRERERRARARSRAKAKVTA